MDKVATDEKMGAFGRGLAWFVEAYARRYPHTKLGKLINAGRKVEEIKNDGPKQEG